MPVLHYVLFEVTVAILCLVTYHGLTTQEVPTHIRITFQQFRETLACGIWLNNLCKDGVVHRQHTAVGEFEAGAMHAQLVVHHDLEVRLIRLDVDIDRRYL